jgi:hypothetical protein
MVHKKKTTYLTAGDMAFLVKSGELETTLGKIEYLGDKKKLDATYKHLFGKGA